MPTPRVVKQCIAGVSLPNAPRQRGSVFQELHCPLPPRSETAYCRSCTAHCPEAVRQYVEGVPLPTVPMQ